MANFLEPSEIKKNFHPQMQNLWIGSADCILKEQEKGVRRAKTTDMPTVSSWLLKTFKPIAFHTKNF